eukprot:Phypoly_transcript_23951.p2 GENE.Phypoly_transcript_23951~~Phypoly_transcript_23951.p2  ORF type:complete len:129 (+),score=20.02 Phypoly_transcript_23951:1-387(+)
MPTLLSFLFPGMIILIIDCAFGLVGNLIAICVLARCFKTRHSPSFGLFFITSKGLFYMKSSNNTIEKCVDFESTDMTVGVDRNVFRREDPPNALVVFEKEGVHIINETLKSKSEQRTIDVVMVGSGKD